MKSVQLSMSTARSVAPSSTAPSTNQCAPGPTAASAAPAMKNAASPRSASAMAAARDNGANVTRTVVARTMGMSRRPVFATGAGG